MHSHKHNDEPKKQHSGDWLGRALAAGLMLGALALGALLAAALG